MKEKILIALSDKELAKILVQYLSELGYKIEIVQNGKDVISRMKSSMPDLLLIDTTLPDKSGYEILTEKSFDRDITKIPVLIVSNSGEPIITAQIPSTPTIIDYIVKIHIEPEDVVEKIEKVFGRGPIIETKTVKRTDTGHGKIVLWVEDDKLLGTILSKKFEMSGYTLFKARNSDELFELLKTTIPNIIILDIMLPGMSGLEILEKVKKENKFKAIPIMMLSNLDNQEDINKAKSLGANKFMVKATSSLDEIIDAVEKVITG